MENIIDAIQKQNLKEVHRILIHDPMAIEQKDTKGVWAPFVAAATGNVEIMRYIVEYSRASFNTVDENNQNVLHYAARGNNRELMAYLIDYVGMDPLKGDKNGQTPIDIAYEMDHQEVIAYLREEKGIKVEGMYRNPIIRGTYPDPSIVRVGEDYYMVHSSFVFFPCVPILHSKDLVHWKTIGHAVTDPSYVDLDSLDNGRGFWAPDISYHKGKFYIAATYRLNDGGTVYRKQIVVSSDKPEGPYSKPSFIDEDGIDPSIFTDDDGKRYMLLNRGARIFEISEDGTKQLSDAKLLWYGDNKRAPEGPHLLKKDGYYYLFVAEGGTGLGHRIAVARSKNLMGPYENCPYNPIMRQKDPLASIQRAGHGKPVQTQNGEWYMVYLCGRNIDGKYSLLGRETSMDPITWTSDGWPLVNHGKGPSVLQHKPNLPVCIWESTKEDHFKKDQLGADWIFARLPREDAYELKGGKLRMFASPYDLHHRLSKNVIVQRQKDFCFEVETKILLTEQEERYEAGITGYYDTDTYFKYGVVIDGENLSLRVVQRIDEDESVHFKTDLKTKEVYLKISTNYLSRTFDYSVDGENWITIGTLAHVYYLCDEGIQKGKRFTGAMVGMYAVGNENQTQNPYVDFEYFHYKALEEKRK